MSAEAQPISPARFAEALKDLPVSSLHLKVLELRRNIARLDYSNAELRPYAEGTARPLSAAGTNPSSEPREEATGDPDCIEAIRENEAVIARMQERIQLVRAEVESRGLNWTEFAAAPEEEAEGGADADGPRPAAPAAVNGAVANGDGPASGGDGARRHAAWTDGTFQTGVIRDGTVQVNGVAAGSTGNQGGGSRTDDELRRAMEAQARWLSGLQEADGEGGMHL